MILKEDLRIVVLSAQYIDDSAFLNQKDKQCWCIALVGLAQSGKTDHQKELTKFENSRKTDHQKELTKIENSRKTDHQKELTKFENSRVGCFQIL